jgi:hypothetical protein
MYKSESIGSLAGALSKAQAEIKGAEMNAVNPFLKNKYADLGSVIEAARPALGKNGLSFTQLVSGDATNITLDTIIMHESGEYIGTTISLPVGDDKGRSLAQSAGAIITYLRRYGLSAILGVYADEDTDGSEAKAKAQSQAAKPAEQTPTKTNGNAAPAQTSAPNANAWNPVVALVDAGICQNAAGASVFMNKHVPPEVKTPNKLLPWARVYRAWRDAGETVEESVRLASGGSLPEPVEAQDEAARQAAND